MTRFLPGSSPSRHFERREGPGDEVTCFGRGNAEYHNKDIDDNVNPEDRKNTLLLPHYVCSKRVSMGLTVRRKTDPKFSRLASFLIVLNVKNVNRKNCNCLSFLKPSRKTVVGFER